MQAQGILGKLLALLSSRGLSTTHTCICVLENRIFLYCDNYFLVSKTC